jgi:hypothetical protein
VVSTLCFWGSPLACDPSQRKCAPATVDEHLLARTIQAKDDAGWVTRVVWGGVGWGVSTMTHGPALCTGMVDETLKRPPINPADSIFDGGVARQHDRYAPGRLPKRQSNRAFGDVPGRRKAARKTFLTPSSIAQLVTSPASRKSATRLRMPAPGQRRPLGALPGCEASAWPVVLADDEAGLGLLDRTRAGGRGGYLGITGISRR